MTIRVWCSALLSVAMSVVSVKTGDLTLSGLTCVTWSLTYILMAVEEKKR
jgi:hypothetical protein